MNAINWLKDHSEVTEYPAQDFNGQMVATKSYSFNGTLPYRMAQEIKAAATSDRSSNRETTYNGSGEMSDWAATFGARKTTATACKFSANDYTVVS